MEMVTKLKEILVIALLFVGVFCVSGIGAYYWRLANRMKTVIQEAEKREFDPSGTEF